MNLFENLLAYDKERKQIVSVLSVTTSDLNGRTIGECSLNNGNVTYTKNHLKDECILLPYTHQQDSEKNNIHLDDLLENDVIIFRVEWNRNQACWWLKPIIVKPYYKYKNDEFFYLTIENQQLGNGYFSRKDLKKIGNYHTDGLELIEKFEGKESK